MVARRRSETLLVTKVTVDGASRCPDELIVEEPLSIQLNGDPVATTMRTPGHDFELAVGFCHSEGLLAGAAVTGVRYCGTGPAADTEFNVVTVETGTLAPVPQPRLGVTSSACGWCGTDQIDELTGRLRPLDSARITPIPLGVVRAIPATVLDRQGLFARTGSVHAAAAFTPAGEVVVAREDVGRHNAVDKVIGRLLLDGALPAHELGLFVSGRASFEIVAKAWAAGFGTVVAVSAPTALAVRTARRGGLMLAGFVRRDRLNIYAPERLAPGAVAGSLDA